MKKQKKLDVNSMKKYNLPQNTFIKEVEGVFVVVAIDYANWVVLNNKQQVEIYLKLEKTTVGEVYQQHIAVWPQASEEFETAKKDFVSTLTEIEAKDFEKQNKTYLNRNGLTIFLTNQCNLRCKHCYMYSGHADEEELSLPEVKKLLEDFKKHGGEGVTFTGGEVTERADLLDVLKYSKKIGLLNMVLSNGTGWDEELIAQTAFYIDEIQISIDGFDEETSGKIRGEGNFVKALATLEKFIELGVKARVAVTPLIDELEEKLEGYIAFEKKMRELYKGKPLEIRFSRMLLEGRNLKPTKEENERYKILIDKIIEGNDKQCLDKEFALNHKGNIIFDNCGYGGIAVASNGNVYFCSRISDVACFGNIRTEGFEKIVDYSNKIREISEVSNMRPCGQCELRYVCGGQCRIEYFSELVEVDREQLVDKEKKPFTRNCSNETKENLYKMMISANKFLYI